MADFASKVSTRDLDIPVIDARPIPATKPAGNSASWAVAGGEI